MFNRLGHSLFFRESSGDHKDTGGILSLWHSQQRQCCVALALIIILESCFGGMFYNIPSKFQFLDEVVNSTKAFYIKRRQGSWRRKELRGRRFPQDSGTGSRVLPSGERSFVVRIMPWAYFIVITLCHPLPEPKGENFLGFSRRTQKQNPLKYGPRNFFSYQSTVGAWKFIQITIQVFLPGCGLSFCFGRSWLIWSGFAGLCRTAITLKSDGSKTGHEVQRMDFQSDQFFLVVRNSVMGYKLFSCWSQIQKSDIFN